MLPRQVKEATMSKSTEESSYSPSSPKSSKQTSKVKSMRELLRDLDRGNAQAQLLIDVLTGKRLTNE